MMLVLCIDKGNGDPNKVILPEPGVVYKARKARGPIFSPTGSNIWYVLDKTGNFLQNPILFEQLPNDYLTNLSEISVKIETKILN